MAIGITTDTDFDRELRSLGIIPEEDIVEVADLVEIIPEEEIRTPEVIPEVIDIPVRGRKEGDVNIPESLRKIIGEEAVINGRQSALELAADFGISASSVSAYAKGATSTTSYNKPKSDIIEHINKSRHRYIKKASHVMHSALKAISQDKLDYTDAKDLSGIAKDMSVIIKNLEPPAPPVSTSDTQSPQFVIYAPQFKSETFFESMVVNE